MHETAPKFYWCISLKWNISSKNFCLIIITKISRWRFCFIFPLFSRSMVHLFVISSKPLRNANCLLWFRFWRQLNSLFDHIFPEWISALLIVTMSAREKQFNWEINPNSGCLLSEERSSPGLFNWLFFFHLFSRRGITKNKAVQLLNVKRFTQTENN